MNISWIIATGYILDPLVKIEDLKSIGSFWGSWQTWRSNSTDNVICYDQGQAKELIDRSFHKNCNFYVPKNSYQFLNRPAGVQIFDGEFQHDIAGREDDIISMHLASSRSDIILLLGFDFSEPVTNPSRLLEHQAHNYRQLTKQVILSSPEIQWVLIDHPKPIRKDCSDLSNLTSDTLVNVLDLLRS